MAAFDPSKPNIARIYDALRDGKDNFGPDRDAAEAIREIAADGQKAAHDNRAFHGRAVRFLAREQGISQFLDIGAEMPADQNTHEIASGINKAARTAYIDYDQVVTGHAKAVLEDQTASIALPGDLRSPREFLDNPELRRFIDFRRPVAVMLLAVLHFIETPLARSRTDTPGCTPDSAADVKPGHAPGTGTGTPVKRLPTPLPGPDSRPLCVRGHRNTSVYSATR